MSERQYPCSACESIAAHEPTAATGRYYLWNIGCQMNRADARRIAEELERRGYTATQRPAAADLILLNTCVVRQSAEDKVVGRLNSLRSLQRPGGPKLLVMGCFVGQVAELQQRFPFVDAFFAPSDIANLLAYVDGLSVAGGHQAALAMPAAEVSELVPISYGCDHHCTYCIVTIRRGPQRSRLPDEIAAEVEGLVQRGAREITLLGQNVDAYGQDLPGKPSLADLLQAIHAIQGLWRIRFLTSHPRDMTPRIIETAAALPRVCEAWELPVQAGDDTVLRRMARGYDVAHYRDLVQHIRSLLPTSSINTDIIVGFPGETTEQFERTVSLLQELRFDMVHVAAYSPRPGTPATRWPDDVPAEEKERRRALVEKLQTDIATQLNAALLGSEQQVLVDGQQRGRWRGRTRTNKLVFFESERDWLGQMARVRITWTGPWSLLGEVLD